MEKRVKVLRILMGIWLALGLVAMFYVMIFTRKSNIVLASIFIVGFAAIAIPLHSADEKLREEKKNSK